MVSTIGLIGLILLALAWLPQTYSVIKKKKSNINPLFGTFYVIGSLILVYYSIQIQDNIFLILNITVAIMSAISLYFSTGKRKL
jgi:lipid-A-disaccharide synthase-like uncharacterized protein